jgi:hypothetical protein
MRKDKELAMTWRSALLLAGLLAGLSLCGCSRTLTPPPLSADEQRELERQMEQVEEEEQSRGAEILSSHQPTEP